MITTIDFCISCTIFAEPSCIIIHYGSPAECRCTHFLLRSLLSMAYLPWPQVLKNYYVSNLNNSPVKPWFTGRPGPWSSLGSPARPTPHVIRTTIFYLEDQVWFWETMFHLPITLFSACCHSGRSLSTPESDDVVMLEISLSGRCALQVATLLVLHPNSRDKMSSKDSDRITAAQQTLDSMSQLVLSTEGDSRQ